MKRLSYTLLGDGSSDRLLEHVIDWALHQRNVNIEQRQWADFSRLRQRPSGLDERIRSALELYPCDVLFIHRDAERDSHGVRLTEIQRALPEAGLPHVPIIPVRMTEAWFLHDEDAIRSASGNPRGTVSLHLESAG